MERWEYQVIHLNVEAPSPAPPAAPPPGVEPTPGAPPVPGEAVFSQEYLEKEFPGFYGTPPAAGAPSREHPANQLRGFLNLQGREGWQLLGFYPVGQLQMMIFRRPLQGQPTGTPPAAPASALDRPGGAAVPSAPATAVQPPDPSAVLESILARLAALEQRLPPASPPLPELTPPRQDLTALQDGAILPPQRWGELDGLPRRSTAEAARALGFRSAASLLNLAARSGYRQGLVKRGADATLAVYMGSERSVRGGRDRRLWVVLRGGSS